METSAPTALPSLDADAIATRVAPLVPRSLASVFDARFIRSDRLFDEYVSRLVVRVVRETGLADALAAWGTVDEVVARGGLEPARAAVPVSWMLRRLLERGAVERRDEGGQPQFRAGSLPAAHPEEILDAQRRYDPAALPSYTLATTAADAYPVFLAGTRSGEEILLAAPRLPLWNAYFSNEHVLYAVNNRVGASALAAWLPPGPSAVLELGAGMGSGTVAALAALRTAGRLGDVSSYRATDVVPTFLRYAERRARDEAKDAPGLTFDKLDMNQAFASQGVLPGTVSVVYAVNTLHVAHDLFATLREIREALGPGGRLIVAECVRPRPGQTLYPEFVFNMLTTFRAPRLEPPHRPNGGFLTPEQWHGALEAAGFAGVQTQPDMAAMREAVPFFSVAAIAATLPA